MFICKDKPIKKGQAQAMHGNTGSSTAHYDM